MTVSELIHKLSQHAPGARVLFGGGLGAGDPVTRVETTTPRHSEEMVVELT